ncbi:phospho-N-acetylmuramoyl-pentapeptide-transferase [Candidatus Saccharibacteria bacterium]|nr:phospho-N-acetylmuramoyl-pentapeptide-transferase [Candidatus Saccharibacteria bacterium]
MFDTTLSVQMTHILLQGFVCFVLAMIFTPIYTRYAFKLKLWKQQRETTTTGEKAPIFRKLHAAKFKRNIPTMAGIIGVVAVTITMLTLNWSRNQTYLPVFGLVAAGAVGFLDDLINIRGSGKGVAGLRSSLKFFLIFGIALVGALYFFFRLGYSQIHVPAVGNFEIGWLYIPLFVLVVVATANAVNIADGLDGLAGGLLASSFGAFAVIAFAQANYGIAGFCLAMVGAVLAYTWFNIYPARFFMGDTGSFAFGTALGIVAMLTNMAFVLPIVGAVFVVEAGSSVIQILSKKIFKRKIFLSAPLHHHLEAIGWPETKVTMRLWIIGAVSAGFGMLIGLIARG